MQGAMAPRCLGAMAQWCLGAMAPRCLCAKVPRSHGAMAPRCLGALVPWCHGATEPWCLGAFVPWRHGALVPWRHGAKLPWCHGARISNMTKTPPSLEASPALHSMVTKTSNCGMAPRTDVFLDASLSTYAAFRIAEILQLRCLPPTADGFGTGTPVPSPQSQSFSQTYGSILPTSLAYIVPSTRGCSPWRPDAVMSTTGRGRHSVLRIFKGRRERTGHHATCGALPAAGPYLRLSRFQGGQAVKQKR
ncbi:hypothetical protein CQW23_35016 [Capsicum baccatum]|uniref:Uncharacterized protein n=1 Tax=Capsicum baccatum TaxID=33114 RepID=A0A2G2UXC4_CAPBA|nr:hypothetical protein CQW23_35016 [Capsicum baccatum]